MKIAFYGDSLTEGIPGVAFLPILGAKLPEHELINYGKGGDTGISLYRRIVRRQLDLPVDIAFLWVGVNDVFAKVTLAHSILKRLVRQPWAKDHAEFRDYYALTLDLLCQKAANVVTVSPLLIGEDLENSWNQELAELCEIVASVSSAFGNVHYLDLRARFRKELEGRVISDYIPKSNIRIARDMLSLRTPAQIDAAARDRGLHLTLDGVHLNSAGAKVVADVFLKMINAFCRKG